MPRAGYQDAYAGGKNYLNQILGSYPDLNLSDADKENIIQQSLPLYESDWNGLEQGNAAISQYVNNLHQTQYNSPLAIQQRQQAQWTAAAPKYADSINNIIQSNLGRAATQDEVNHYGSLIASGAADPYTIQQFIQATPEYQNAADTKFRSGLDTQLQQSDQAFFDRSKGSIAQQYALMGRSTSPALDVALTDLASQLSSQRQSYLAQVGANQYQGNKNAAQTDYENQRQNVAGSMSNNVNAIYGSTLQNNQDLIANRNYGQQQNNWWQAQGQFRPTLGPLDYLNAGLNAGKTGGQIASSFSSNGLPAAAGGGAPPVGLI